jgi:hypothetical protein
MRINDAKKLVHALRDAGVSLFVLSYHAPSLVVGNTPYVNSIADRDELLRWLDEFYEFFFNEIGGAPATTAMVYEAALEANSSA